MPRKSPTTRLQKVKAPDLREMLDKLTNAAKKLRPIVDAMELDPNRSIEVDGKKMADTGVTYVGKFIGNCDKAMGL